ncbi:beta-N-acetylhexosaminidase [Ketogulonicigenium robustum]|uniref:beta-N-acetylhexosaminidase n=1 Tax=Ketogulonicigenium robustum TaxID=92947 RepID=A0A1W6NW97_9RHOB|nr:glycoside hydrolase family 3 N-terminal domain-containing protein [Ketogulonicigenium robustum]ARO13506.1 beta-N-acetylhexosaminidase [Ketogulonicigenium robustum]
MTTTPLALCIGMPGTTLSADEVAFLRDANPFGLFVFKRNLETPDQIRRLTAQFREAVGRDDAQVFVDQEGGRVTRLDNGNWPLFRPLADFGALAHKDMELAQHALRLSTLAMGTMLADLTLNSGASPVVDLRRDYTHGVMGHRVLDGDPAIVSALGRVIVDALLETGQLPMIKHIPGYGHVEVDPHLELPVVNASLDDMRASDFLPFLALKDSPWAMVAHTLYTQIDAENVATQSPAILSLIRNELDYDGVLISDCITMDALSGTWPERVARVLGAGYDIALQCQGELSDYVASANVSRPLSAETMARITRGTALLGDTHVDVWQTHAEVEDMFKSAGAL